MNPSHINHFCSGEPVNPTASPSRCLPDRRWEPRSRSERPDRPPRPRRTTTIWPYPRPPHPGPALAREISNRNTTCRVDNDAGSADRRIGPEGIPPREARGGTTPDEFGPGRDATSIMSMKARSFPRIDMDDSPTSGNVRSGPSRARRRTTFVIESYRQGHSASTRWRRNTHDAVSCYQFLLYYSGQRLHGLCVCGPLRKSRRPGAKSTIHSGSNRF